MASLTEPKIAELMQGNVLVFTGAGISAASGIPTFRGDGGLYEGLNPYELASPEAFARQPVTVWNWYLMRIHQGKSARPNPAHLALAQLEEKAELVTIVTSNVDPLHDRAGSTNVYRLHGNILETYCPNCGEVLPIYPDFLPERYTEETLPRSTCGAVVRPNVVWFGERPWPDAFEAVRRELPQADVVLEVGQSGMVSYGFTEIAARTGIPTVRINPEGEAQPGVFLINEGAETVLPRLVALIPPVPPGAF
jgi:NAD-dependent deacetylase